MVKALGPEMSAYRILIIAGRHASITPYEPLIYASFLHSLRLGNEWFQDIETDVYYKAYHDVLQRCLTSADAQVRLAVLDDDRDVCLGWSLSRGPILDYVFVKEDKLTSFRKQGIGSALLPRKFDTITQLTRIGRNIWKTKFPQVSFNPFR